MKQRPRIYYTESQKVVMWVHWKKGKVVGQKPPLKLREIWDSFHL